MNEDFRDPLKDPLGGPSESPVWVRVGAVQTTVFLELTVDEVLFESTPIVEQVWAIARGYTLI